MSGERKLDQVFERWLCENMTFPPCLPAPWGEGLAHLVHIMQQTRAEFQKRYENQIPRDLSQSRGASEAAFLWSSFTEKLIMISPKLNDRFHQAPSLLWLLNLCSELKGWLANAMVLLTSPRLILCDLAIYLGVQATDKPIGERKSFKFLASFWYDFYHFIFHCSWNTKPSRTRRGEGDPDSCWILCLDPSKQHFLTFSPQIYLKCNFILSLIIFFCKSYPHYWLRWEKSFHVPSNW